ncbi:MAG: hypothetical protein ACI9UK_000456, partial [Candidatus Krumholzibacteriia bacterium]
MPAASLTNAAVFLLFKNTFPQLADGLWTNPATSPNSTSTFGDPSGRACQPV